MLDKCCMNGTFLHMENWNHRVLWSLPFLLQSGMRQHRCLHTVMPVMTSAHCDVRDFEGFYPKPAVSVIISQASQTTLKVQFHKAPSLSCTPGTALALLRVSFGGTDVRSTFFHRNFLVAPWPKMALVFLPHFKWQFSLKNSTDWYGASFYVYTF